MTAEVLTGVSSTLTRTFVVEINNGDVKNDLLSFYQTQRWILPTYAYDFLTWVTERFQGVVEYIGQQFPQWRKAIRFQYARYAEMYATFCCVGGLLAQYTQDRGFWNKEQAEQFLEETRNYVFSILSNNQEKLEEKNKGGLVIQALEKAMETAKIVPLELNEQTCQLRNDLYEDSARYYIRAQTLLKLANRYSFECYRERRIFSSDELLLHLEISGVLEIEETAGKRLRSRKLPIQRGNTLRYLYLSKARIHELLNEE